MLKSFLYAVLKVHKIAGVFKIYINAKAVSKKILLFIVCPPGTQ